MITTNKNGSKQQLIELTFKLLTKFEEIISISLLGKYIFADFHTFKYILVMAFVAISQTDNKFTHFSLQY